MAEEEKQEAEIQQELGSPKPEARSPKPEARSPRLSTLKIEEQEPEARSPKTVTAYIEDRQEQEADAAPPEDETDRLAKEVRDRHPELKKASRHERRVE